MHLAIDWGTSFTKIGFIQNGKMINLAGSDLAIPTAAAYLPASGHYIFGRRALRLSQDAYTAQHFKLELKRNPGFTLGPLDLEELLEKFFDYLKYEYVIPLGQEVESITIGIPNYFGLNARRRLLKVLTRCYATEAVNFIPEPAAAALGYNAEHPGQTLSGEVLIIDIGGGTTDFSFLSIGADDSLTVEAQFQTGHDVFSGTEIDRSIINNIFLPEFTIQTGIDLNQMLTRDLSPHYNFMINRLLQAAESFKRELSRQDEAYLNIPDFFASKSLQLLVDRETFAIRTKDVFSRLQELLQGWIRDQGEKLGLFYDNKWDLDYILLVGGASITPGVQETIASVFPGTNLILPPEREFNVLKGLCRQADNSATSINRIKTIYPFSFFIERYNPDRHTSILDKIPFDTENLKLDINKKYRLLTLKKDTPYNLAADEDHFIVKIFEGEEEAPCVADHFSGREVVFQIDLPVNELPEQIAIYLDLFHSRLEFGALPQYLPGPETNIFDGLLEHQLAAYHRFLAFNLNPELMHDYGEHLTLLKEHAGDNITEIGKSTLFKLYGLMELFTNSK